MNSGLSFIRVLRFYPRRRIFLAAGLTGMLVAGSQSARAAESGARVPGVLEYALKYGEEKQKTEKNGATASQNAPRPAVNGSSKIRVTDGELRKRFRQQEMMLEQVRQENQRLRQVVQAGAATDNAENARLTALLAEMPAVSADELKIPAVQQDYASGVVSARDLLAMLEPEALPGLKTDRRALLAGINDAVNNRVQLSPVALQEALMAADARVQQVHTQMVTAQKAAGEAYLTALRKEKGVQQAESGFWYRTDYAGDGALIRNGETRVEVVVTEKLTDGTVVEDMEATGRSLSMALDDYPPLFRDALRLMKNHATMTLVVPPALAYGDEGYPPKVPPGAMMVYTLRVENVSAGEGGLPETEKNVTSEQKPEVRKPKS